MVPQAVKWMYGEYSNFDSLIMEDWNMNTHIGKKIISPDRIEMLTDSKGKDDALSVIQEMYQNYKSSKINLKELDGFMNYVKERYYYHHTELSKLQSILKTGLEPRNGELSKVIKDKKTKVFFTEGMEGTIALTSTFQQKFDYMKRIPEWKDKTLDDLLGERVFLRFLSEGIDNESDKGEFAFADGWTSKAVEPEKLKVCLLRNIKTGEVSYKRDDIIKYMLKTNPIEGFKNIEGRHKECLIKYYEMRSEELSNFNLEDYELEDMDLERFCKKYIEKNEKKDETSNKQNLFSPQEIGKATINVPTKEKNEAQKNIEKLQIDEKDVER